MSLSGESVALTTCVGWLVDGAAVDGVRSNAHHPHQKLARERERKRQGDSTRALITFLIIVHSVFIKSFRFDLLLQPIHSLAGFMHARMWRKPIYDLITASQHPDDYYICVLLCLSSHISVLWTLVYITLLIYSIYAEPKVYVQRLMRALDELASMCLVTVGKYIEYRIYSHGGSGTINALCSARVMLINVFTRKYFLVN